MPGEFRQVSLSGGNVEYQYLPGAGGAGGCSIILLHDGLGCAATWRDLPQKLSRATGCEVIAPSRYGYGRSSACDLPRPLDYMQNEGRAVLPELVSALNIGRHIVIGHSDGGSIALVYAGSAARPGLLGVATIAAHVFCEQVCVDAVHRAINEYDNGALREALARYHGDNVDHAFRGWSGAWSDPGFKLWNIEKFLPAIDIPTIVIQGRQDEYGTLEQVDRTVAGIGQNADGAVIEDCGHAPHREQPEALLNILREFSGNLVA